MQNEAIIVSNVFKTFKIDTPKSFSSFITKRKSNLSKITALNDISFSVKKGEVLGLIGLNGSGKSTLLRVIAGIYRPDKGAISINGVVSQLLQLGTGFQGDLNAIDNITMNLMLFGLSKSKIKEKIQSIIEYAELEEYSNMKLKDFSAGMRARLAFSTALQIESEILLVDEILSVGDKDFQKKSYETFRSIIKSNKTIIHSTHNLQKIAEFSDRVLLLHKGKKIMIGNPHEVIKKYQELKPQR